MMMRKLLTSTAIWCTSLSAMASCPTNHFEPSVEMFSFFPGAEQILAEQSSGSPNAELAFAFVEFGVREPGFGSAYVVSLMRQGASGDGTLFLNRLKDGKPIASHVRMSANEVRELINEVTPILLKTHYSPSACPVHFTHGIYVQMAVEQPGRGLIGGQAFGPIEESEVTKAVAIGRQLKERALSAEGG
jgi:hypothetical protein